MWKLESFYKLISEVTSHDLYHILSFRSESLGLVCHKGKRLHERVSTRRWGSLGPLDASHHKWLLALVKDLSQDRVCSEGIIDFCQHHGLPSSKCCWKQALPAVALHVPFLWPKPSFYIG